MTQTVEETNRIRDRVIHQTGYGFDGCKICCCEWMSSPNMELKNHIKSCIAHPNYPNWQAEQMKDAIRGMLIDFLNSIRDYEHESGHSVYNDDRETHEFVDTYFETLKSTRNAK